ncbi:MAG: HIT family protein [Fibrobacterota bacterium]
MDRMWAPWRMEYVSATDDKKDACVFCGKEKPVDDKKDLLLYRGGKCFVLMNLYPYNNGHLMVIPFRHLNDVSLLDADERKEIFDLTVKSKEVLAKVYSPHGFNVGMNLGRPAGAGIDEHIHMHILPRWNGDTNFMPVIAHTKVISEGMESSWEKLRAEFDKV